MSATCAGTTKKGTPCGHTAHLLPTPAGLLCLWHNPARASERTAMRRKGARAAAASRVENSRVRLALASTGAGPATGTRPKIGDSLESIGEWLMWCIDSAARGGEDGLTTEQLRAFTSAARVLQGVYEKRDYERKLKAALKELALYRKGDKRAKR